MLAIVSGGMDSVTMAYELADKNKLSAIVTFDYQQRHVKEIGFASKTARKFGVGWKLLSIPAMSQFTSALTKQYMPIPDGHYTDESMKSTVVPARNSIFLATAWGLAMSLDIDGIATAVHAGDHTVYPDCRPEFIRQMQMALRLGSDRQDMKIHAPYVNKTKSEIVSIGAGLHVPYAETWSCYKGWKIHCGTCGTCVERKEAFAIAGVYDPTEYKE